jgi:hypothetical protein
MTPNVVLRTAMTPLLWVNTLGVGKSHTTKNTTVTHAKALITTKNAHGVVFAGGAPSCSGPCVVPMRGFACSPALLLSVMAIHSFAAIE